MRSGLARDVSFPRLHQVAVLLLTYFVLVCALMVTQSALGSNADLDPERITESRLKREDAAIIKPKIDEWSYRSLVLPNGLEALLVSDDKADMAAAAMDVRALFQSQSTPA
jgi:hypothetical protein